MSDLLPCPFCGSKNIHHNKQVTRNDIHHWVTCHDCLVQTGLTPDEWNTRTQPTYNPATHLLIAREDVPEGLIDALHTMKIALQLKPFIHGDIIYQAAALLAEEQNRNA